MKRVVYIAFVVCIVMTTLIVEPMSFRARATVPLRGAASSTSMVTTGRTAVEAYAKQPLRFELNQGQTDRQVLFLSRGHGSILFLTSTEVVLNLVSPQATPRTGISAHSDPRASHDPRKSRASAQSSQRTPLHLRFLGSNPKSHAIGINKLPGVSNYFIGNDPHTWHTNVPSYAEVQLQGVYPGVNLLYYGKDGTVEYDWQVAPGADVRAIRLAISGTDQQLTVDAHGNLILHTTAGTVLQHAPNAYQEVSGVKKSIVARYVLPGQGQVGIALDAYDHSQALVIDPVFTYSTYLGGSGDDSGNGIAVDGTGNAYITGSTSSLNFPIANALQGTLGGGYDAFVTKLNAAGSALLYSTYLGGSGSEGGASIAVDGTGNAYITGETSSTDFPIANALQGTLGGRGQNAFVTKLNAAGTALLYSTYLGGSGDDTGYSIAVDGTGNAYITGVTTSSNFPTANALQGTLGGQDDAFVSKLNAAGSALLYSTYLGGSSHDIGRSIAVDGTGNAYITGSTSSTNFPIDNALQGTLGGNDDAFVSKLNAAGSALLYSTYLGGSGGDEGTGIAVDGTGNAYITGGTFSTNFPTANALQGTLGGNDNAFVSKLNAAGSALLYSTYLGGSGFDEGYSIVVDGTGNAYITGTANSPNFPTANALQGTLGGQNDAFVTKLNAAGSALLYSTYLGGSGSDEGYSIAVDGAGNAYITGGTFSTNFPTANALQGTLGGQNDAFVTKISALGLPPQPPQPPLTGGDVKSPETLGNLPLCFPCLVKGLIQGLFGDPVNAATGNFSESATDIAIPGRGIPLIFNRTYNALGASTNAPGPLGYGWTFGDNASLSVNNITKAVTIVQENGSQVVFNFSGSSYAPATPRDIATLVHNGDGTWTMTRLANEKLTFSSTGQLISQSDLNGYTTHLTYTSGQLTTITDAAGRALTLGYTGTHLTSVTDQATPTPRKVLFGYNDGAGNLTDVTDVLGHNTHYTYDPNHLLYTMRDQRGNTTTTHYDANGRVAYQIDQLTHKTTFTYAPDGSWTMITDPQNNVTLEQYQHGVRTALTRGYGTPQQATWTFLYDPTSLGVTSVTDPNSHTTTATYDANGNQLTSTDALGRKTTNTYNNFNEVLTTTDPLGVTTKMTYDAAGNLQTRSRPLLGTGTTQLTTYKYTDQTHPGDITSITDANGKTWKLKYDIYGDLTTSIDPQGDKSTSTFNTIGWLLKQVSPKGYLTGSKPSQYTTTFVYDNAGRVKTTKDPLGHVTKRHYDPNGNLDTFTDADGKVTKYTYDAANRLTIVTRPDKTTLVTDYNPDGTILDQKDGNGKATTYGYDPLARATSITDPLKRTTSTSYDGTGNRLTVTDPQSQITTFGYDAANQLTSVTYSDGITPNVTNIQYDNDGQRKAMTDGTGSSSWIWDSLHRLTQAKDGSGKLVSYGYDLKSQLTSILYPGQSTPVQRAYDNAGRLHTVTDWLGNTTTFTPDANSNPGTIVFPTGTNVTDTYTFNNVDQLTGISDAKSGTPFMTFAYQRDNVGQLTQDTSTGVPGSTHAYGYSPLNQVCYDASPGTGTCASPPNNAKPYTYDAADNLTQLFNGTVQAYDDANELCWTLPSASSNACSSPPSGATTYGYDKRGNRILVTPPSGSPTALAYDQANRLTAYGSSATYVYNSDGLRVKKVVSGTTYGMVWNQAQGLPLLMQDGTAAYIYGVGGQLLERISGNTVSYYHTDQLGSVRVMTDSSGNVLNTYSYDAYGNVTGSTGAAPNAFKFAGEYQDSESGMYYFRARYYDPTTAQFLTRDPLVALTRSPYGYVAGNPLNGTDPGGMNVCGPLGSGSSLCENLSDAAARCIDAASCVDVQREVGLGLAGEEYLISAWNSNDPLMRQRYTSCDINAARDFTEQANRLLTRIGSELSQYNADQNIGHRLSSGIGTAGNTVVGAGPGGPSIGLGAIPGVAATAGSGWLFGPEIGLKVFARSTPVGLGTAFLYGFFHNATYSLQ